MMKVPENPYRQALASMYMEKCLGMPMDEKIKKMVNGDDSDRSLDYYNTSF